MVESPLIDRSALTALDQKRYAQRLQGLWIAAIFSLTGLIGWFMLRGGPSLVYPVLLLALIAGLGIVQQPRFGLYGCVFLALVGDSLLIPPYPFVKNFSSPESILYLNDALIFSPLEVCLLGTLLIWLGREVLQRRLQLRTQHLFWPVMAFSLFVLLGLLYGLATGGDIRIALWEARPLLYLPVLLLLTSHLLTRREHLSQLLWVITLALFIEGLVTIYYFVFVLNADLMGNNSITEHSAPVHMNLIIIWTLAVWLFGGTRRQRALLPVLIMPLLVTSLLAQRRAAWVGLLVALCLLALVLFQARPRLFWMVAPAVGVAGLLFVAAFWNNTGALGTPVRAVKAILAPAQASERDQQSNAYRVIENANVLFTIQQAPLTGVGFGRKFNIVIPLPDISFFEWWEYIVHNSILWIWIKTGILGFLVLLNLIGSSIVVGLRAFWRMPTGELRAISLAAVLYMVMHFIYAYVDMSWDVQSMVLVGAMLGLLSALEAIVAQPVPVPVKRWPWQTEPPPLPGLL